MYEFAPIFLQISMILDSPLNSRLGLQEEETKISVFIPKYYR